MAGLTLAVVLGVGIFVVVSRTRGTVTDAGEQELSPRKRVYEPRKAVDTAGYITINSIVPEWPSSATLEDISKAFKGAGYRSIKQLDKDLEDSSMPRERRVSALLMKVRLLNYEGDAKAAYKVLEEARAVVEEDDLLAQQAEMTIVVLQGITALRRGENENCILCRGESSCIIPISPAAVHIHPEGSRLAIEHFTEYLEHFPDDLEMRWLLNIAHMTLGEHPDKVDPRFLVSLEHFRNNEFDIGRFRDIGHKLGLNHLNQAGGGIMEDFDNDGLLDIVTSTFDATSSMSFFRNTGKGTFENRTAEAGLSKQLGGLNCMQTDYNNDGWMDIFVIRGAWLIHPVRPSLLRNNQNGTFTDVTHEAGLSAPVNSISSSWADYDNDGWLDLFIPCEIQASRLYHNLGNGKFEDVSIKSGLYSRKTDCKGAAWIDFDNDGWQDLFVNYLLPDDGAQLYRNNHNGTFTDVTAEMGIDGPRMGFSCWAWDFDNDGWQDIFATCYDRSLKGMVQGLTGVPHEMQSNRLYRNQEGRGFEDVTAKVGLDRVLVTMGSNFGDLDNDGFLDMYLGTGDPDLATLVPNWMFKNVDGRRFSDVTASSGTGNLQKGHGIAFGDWDRDGHNDIFIEMGGASNGDQYHNVMFQNPGHPGHSLTVKLKGVKSNTAAIGARVKVVTAGDKPQTIHRHISSGSSFGANPLQQTIGLGSATEIATLEISWPATGTTQLFKNIKAGQAIEITEFAEEYKSLNWTQIPIPK